MPKILPCDKCNALCCRTVTLEYPNPETPEDFEDLRWILLHQKVNFIVKKGQWWVELQEPCTWLTPENRCQNYGERPTICREYAEKPEEVCLYYKEADSGIDLRLASLPDLETYLKQKQLNNDISGRVNPTAYKLLLLQKTRVGVFEEPLGKFTTQAAAQTALNKAKRWYDFLVGKSYTIIK